MTEKRTRENLEIAGTFVACLAIVFLAFASAGFGWSCGKRILE